MKRSTFRKSSLISSVALLLVAIVALSGATFAWFSSNDSTKASGIQMTASAASGLYIARTNASALADIAASDWKGSIEFGKNLGEARPTSPNFATITNASFITTKTDNADGSYAGAAGEDAGTGDYVAEHFWVKGDATTAATLEATISITGTKVKGYERVGLYDVTGSAWVGGGVLNSTGTMTVVDAEGNTSTVSTYKPLIYNTSTTDNTTDLAEGNAITLKAAGTKTVASDWVAADGRHFIVYVWFEGQDTACRNENSGADFTVSVSFKAIAP